MHNLQKKIAPPFFEVGPKAYLYGKEALALARDALRASQETGVSGIYTPQLTDLRLIAENVHGLYLCAQHMDPIEPGKGQGSILAEALKDAGADCHGFFQRHLQGGTARKNAEGYVAGLPAGV